MNGQHSAPHSAPHGESPKIFVAGHRGMAGAAITRALQRRGFTNLVTRTRAELDLVDQHAVRDFFRTERPDQVYMAAAKVGGIHANNTFPAEFIYQNLMVEANLIHQAWASGVKRLLFLGSSCIYPRAAAQPMAEDALLTGLLEPTNEPYAIAKIAGIKLCESYNRQYGAATDSAAGAGADAGSGSAAAAGTGSIDYRSVMPTNLYGPGDNYHPENSHVIPALMRRFHEAKQSRAPEVLIWGSGTPLREFLHVDDMAEAAIHVMLLDAAAYRAHTRPMHSHINAGSGSDISIGDLARLIARVTGYQGSIGFDRSKPDGAPRKLMDSSRLNALGWRPQISLEAGLRDAYANFLTGHREA